jgi:serine O-acetyltransferase
MKTPASSRIDSYSTYRLFLQHDLAAHNLDRWRLSYRYRYPELDYQRRLRLVEYLLTKKGPHYRIARFFARYRLMKASVGTGISIPPGVFGPGLSVAHYGSIVVNSRAQVGPGCRIHSATNIGIGADPTPPRIGRNVYIGPGAVIYGNITIGDNVAIGANAVVNKSVPDNATVVGAPARAINSDGSRSLMPNWFPWYEAE